ncbi:MAG: polymer-forming cytoskeletal protein [Anaerolineales bacterium]
MFRRREDEGTPKSGSSGRVDSVLGEGLAWKGSVSGNGGLRIDGAFDGDISVNGLVVIGSNGRVTCEEIKAVTVIISGSVKGDITAQRIEIMPTGRVWGDVVTTAFATEDGAFMRGQITMEDELDLGFSPLAEPDEEELSKGEESEEA